MTRDTDPDATNRTDDRSTTDRGSATGRGDGSATGRDTGSTIARGDGSTTRRSVLRAGAALGGAAALAGCLEGVFDTRSARSPPLVENRPKAVYIPTHVDGMEMVGTKQPGDYNCGMTFAAPHRFWLITGRDRKQVTVGGGDSMHLMFTLWDPETRIAPPNGNVNVEVTRDGESVVSKSMWPMLSQRMGFHFGDNVALDGDATYEVTAKIGPMDARRAGAFREKFGEATEATFEFEFSSSKVRDLPFQQLDDEKGQLGAVKPMNMEMLPIHQLPTKDQLPGTVLGEVRSGDGRFVATRVDGTPEGVEGSGQYLAVSARTPYNRFPLPFMSVGATVKRGGSAAFDGPLKPTIHPDLDYHYGAAVDSIESGDTIQLEFGAPPQVARHEGYETAFFEFEDQEIEVS